MGNDTIVRIGDANKTKVDWANLTNVPSLGGNPYPTYQDQYVNTTSNVTFIKISFPDLNSTNTTFDMNRGTVTAWLSENTAEAGVLDTPDNIVADAVSWEADRGYMANYDYIYTNEFVETSAAGQWSGVMLRISLPSINPKKIYSSIYVNANGWITRDDESSTYDWDLLIWNNTNSSWYFICGGMGDKGMSMEGECGESIPTPASDFIDNNKQVHIMLKTSQAHPSEDLRYWIDYMQVKISTNQSQILSSSGTNIISNTKVGGDLVVQGAFSPSDMLPVVDEAYSWGSQSTKPNQITAKTGNVYRLNVGESAYGLSLITSPLITAIGDNQASTSKKFIDLQYTDYQDMTSGEEWIHSTTKFTDASTSNGMDAGWTNIFMKNLYENYIYHQQQLEGTTIYNQYQKNWYSEDFDSYYTVYNMGARYVFKMFETQFKSSSTRDQTIDLPISFVGFSFLPHTASGATLTYTDMSDFGWISDVDNGMTNGKKIYFNVNGAFPIYTDTFIQGTGTIISLNASIVNISNLIQLKANTLPSCAAAYNGTIGRNNTKIYYCDGSTWNALY